MEEKKEKLFEEDPDVFFSLEGEDDIPKETNGSPFGWKNVAFIVAILVLAVVLICCLIIGANRSKTTPDEESKAVSSVSDETVSGDMSVPLIEDSDLPSEPSESSEDSQEEQIPDEEMHGWVINQMGYTYLYHGLGVEQFNYTDSTMQKFLQSAEELAAKVPDGTSVFCMPVPTRIGFLYAEIDNAIKKEDEFFNSSQRTFIDTVSEKFSSRIQTINLYEPFAEAYQSDTELFFRTDANWTVDAAYLAYTQFCKATGNAAVVREAYTETRIEGFLGSFYTATQSDMLRRNADVFRYDQNADTQACSVTLYHGGSVYKNFTLASNATAGTSDAYSVYLGRSGAHFKLETQSRTGKKLLIVGDESAAAMLPYLIVNYSEIHYVNAAEYTEEFSALFKDTKFHDVLIMNYVTNAVKGSYPSYLATMAGVTTDG